MSTRPIDDWLRGEYGRIYMMAVLLEWYKCRMYIPLKRTVFADVTLEDYRRSHPTRPTERNGIAAANGQTPHINAVALSGDHMRLQLSGDEGQRVQPDAMEFVGMLCPSCNTRYPRTPDYWHIDKKSVDGLRTDMCRKCHNKRQREYRIQVKARYENT